jgi:hypothetical protein
MAISSGIAGTPPDLNAQVKQLAKMALQSGGDHMEFFKRYLNPANPMRLAAQLAQGIVQQQMQGAQTQQHLNQPQPPTVLDQKEQQQQGMAGMPTERGMFDPRVYAQGGIGAGLGEEPQGQEQGQVQMARGGVVAFQEAGSVADKVAEYLAKNPTDAIANERVAAELKTPQQPILPETPEAKLAREARVAAAQERVTARATAEGTPAASEASRPGPTQPAEPPAAPNKAELKAAEKVTKLDGKIESAINKGKDPTKLIEQRRVLTEGIGAGPPHSYRPSFWDCLPRPHDKRYSQGRNPRRTGTYTSPRCRSCWWWHSPTGSSPRRNCRSCWWWRPHKLLPPPTAAPAAPAAPAAKPSLMQRGLGAIKTGAGAVKDMVYSPDALKTGRMTLDPALKPGNVGMGVARTVLNRAGWLGAAGGAGAYLGNALKDTSGARWLQSLVTPVSPEEHDANLLNNQVTSPETAKIVYDAAVQRESNGMQLHPKGHPKAGQPVTSSKGAIGVGQVMPGTAKEAAQLAGLPWDEERYKNDRDYNYAIGQAYFYKQLDTFKGSIPSALAAYNAGPAVVRSYLTGKPLRLRDGTIINPEGKKTPNGIPPYGETQKYVANIQGRIGNYLADKAKYAPEKPGVVRGVEMVQANLPEFMGGTGGPGGNAVQRFKEDLGDDPLRGASIAGVGNVVEAIPKTIAGVKDAFMGKPTPAPAPTVHEQYADILKNQQPAAPAPAAAPDDKIFGLDRGRLSNFLMQSGAAGLANPSQYASVSLGKGLQAGFTADQAREGKLAERTAKAEEKANDRAERLYKDDLDLAIATRKSNLILNFDQNPELQRAIAKLGLLNTMAPSMRRRVGVDDAELKRLQQLVAALSKVAPAAGAANPAFKVVGVRE